MEQDNHTTAAEGTVDHGHAGVLQDLLARIAPCPARRETRLTCCDMVRGLMMELEDHNFWSIAEAAGHRGPSQHQYLLSRARWDEEQMLQAAADWAMEHLGAGHDAGDAVLIVDETSDVKSPTDCVGAARQYCGTVGGIVLCQVAVTLTYATPAGHALVDRALYLPDDWAADEERRELAGVPDEVMFATRPQLRDTVIPPLRRDQAHRQAWTLRRRRHQYQKITAMGYAASEWTTRRAVAALNAAWQAGRRRCTGRGYRSPGMWAQYDFGDGPQAGGVATVLFCLWLAWSRFRVVLPLLAKSARSVRAAVDVALRRAGGVPACEKTSTCF